jgi:hypothetical protein
MKTFLLVLAGVVAVSCGPDNGRGKVPYIPDLEDDVDVLEAEAEEVWGDDEVDPDLGLDIDEADELGPDLETPDVVPSEVTPDVTADIPVEVCSCEGKECGDDGCGGDCGVCHGFDVCVDGVCGECVPSCEGKACGTDGCGGTCGGCDWTEEVCGADFQCVCKPECMGKVCGPDGCGGSCGECSLEDSNGVCEDGVCGCKPDCTDKECGDDGCGGQCGECQENWECDMEWFWICLPRSYCGDGKCVHWEDETCSTCPADCAAEC